MTGAPWERTLGPAELPVTAIGLGLAALGRPGYLNLGHGADLGSDRSVESLEQRAHTVLDAAYDAGVRYFDAARSYGRAEAFLASWLRRRELAPGDVTVGSKWGYTYTAGWQVDADPPEVKDLSLDTFRRQLGETRELLADHLSLYQIHSATVESGVLDDPAVLDALAELRASGVSVGLSTSGAEQAQTVERALESGGFDTVQATWNLLEPSVGDGARTRPPRGARGDRQGGACERPPHLPRRLSRARAGRTEARGEPRRRRHRRGARPAVGGRRPERRVHDRADHEQPLGARDRVGPRGLGGPRTPRRGARGVLGDPLGPRLELAARARQPGVADLGDVTVVGSAAPAEHGQARKALAQLGVARA